MNPALFYKGKDKTILPADLLATYLTYHANKAEDMKLLFKIRLLEREEKISLREIKWRKHQLEEELKQQAEYYFGCHRVFSDQSLVSTSDSFKKSLYLGPYPTKALIPQGRLKELREKLRSMSTEDQKSKAMKLLQAKRRHIYRYHSPPQSVHDVSADNIGVIEPIETLVGRDSKAEIEHPPDLEPITSPDQKPEIISETRDSLHELQKMKFKRVQSAPMSKHSREKVEGLDLEGRSHAKHKSKGRVRRAKTCVTRRERLTTGFGKFGKEPYRLEDKTTVKKGMREEKPEFTKERPYSDRSRKTKRQRPKSSVFFSALPKHMDTAQSLRARSAISSRQKQREKDRIREEKYLQITRKGSLKTLDTKPSSLSRDERISRKDVLEEKKPGILRRRTAARLDFSKAHRLVCKSFGDSVTDKTVQLDEEDMVKRYLDDSQQAEEKSVEKHKHRRGKRGSRNVELERKSQSKVTDKTEIKIRIPHEEFPSVESESEESKMAITKKGDKEKPASEAHTEPKSHIKRWTDAAGHVVDQGECKRFFGHQAKKQNGKKHKISVFKKRSFSGELKGKQSDVESSMRKKVLEYLKVYKDEEEEEKNDENGTQENEY